MNSGKKMKIFLAGHNGMVGSAIKRCLIKNGYNNIITKSRNSLDLVNQNLTYKFLKKIKPDFVILAAAKVGGIDYNSRFKHEYFINNGFILV